MHGVLEERAHVLDNKAHMFWLVWQGNTFPLSSLLLACWGSQRKNNQWKNTQEEEHLGKSEVRHLGLIMVPRQANNCSQRQGEEMSQGGKGIDVAGNCKWGRRDLSGVEKEKLIPALTSWNLQLPVHWHQFDTPGVLKKYQPQWELCLSKDLKLRPIVRNLFF